VGDNVAKRFKGKSKKKKNFKSFIKLLMFIISIYISYEFTFYLLAITNLNVTNEKFLSSMINNTNHHILYEKVENNWVNSLVKIVTSIDFSKPKDILVSAFPKYQESETTSIETDDYSNMNLLSTLTDHISDPNPTDVNKPRVYIYNTHQLENYSMNNLEIYNIKPNVMMASYLLKEKLNKLNIPTIVEETNITEILRVNSWNHASSYKVSRMLILDAKEKNPSLDFYIDLHRDSITKKASTVKINGVSMAKVLFVVGLENPGYEANLKLAKELSSLIEKKYPGLSRGVYTKKGEGVNGVYNQDISPNMILLECGGYQNTIEEVKNTVEAFALILEEYLGE